MNSENLEYLKNGIKFLGFDEKLGAELEKQMKQGSEEIHLKTQNGFNKDDKDIMNSVLNFRKSDQADMYFFNSYTAGIKHGEETRQQTFYIQKNKGVTSKEAFNLLEGRSVNKDLVNKDGEKYNAWLKLDFEQKDERGNYKVKQFHTNYGFKLDEAVAKHPIKELGETEAKDKLMKSLEKGNVQSVTFVKDGKEEKMFVEANPQFKSVDVYDSQMKKQMSNNSKQDQGKEGPSAGESQKNDKTSKKDNKEENSLTPKKRVGKNKGMGVK